MTGFDNLSADVLAVINDGDRRQEQREFSATEREALRKLREKQREEEESRARKAEYDSQRTRAGYDLPRWLIEKIREIAQAESVSASGIAARLLIAGLEQWREWELPIETRLCDSPRFDREVVLPEKDELF